MNLTKTIQESYEQVDRKPITEIHTSEYTYKILDAYKSFLALHNGHDNPTNFINNLQSHIGTINRPIYTQQDITEFCFQLVQFESNNSFYSSGIFLSKLINDHYDRTHEKKEYVLVTDHLQKKMHYLCEENNGANIRVQGSVDAFFAARMKKGNIILEGNCESHLGILMEGGFVHVLGNCGTSCGNQMFGGDIKIEGNVGNLIGSHLFGGVIEVQGNVGTDIGVNMRGGLLKFHEDITGKISDSINTTEAPYATIQVNGKRVI